jgi:hypothetical protein
VKTAAKTIKIAIVAMPMLLGIGCSKNVSFGHVEAATSESVTPPKSPDDPITCEPGQVVVTVPEKILFLVDQSGSNVNGPFEHPGQATDKTKSFRYGVLNEFFQHHGDKSHLSWGFVTFNGTAAQGLIYSGTAASPVFTNDHDVVAQSLVTFQGKQDVGNTPVKAALQAARSMIQNDMLTAGHAAQYRIVMVTDGYPTDYCPGGATQTLCPTTMLESAIDADVQAIMGVSPGNIQINMVYYGFPDSLATARLQRLASIGQGQFVDTNTSMEVHLDDLIEVTQPICQ